MTHVSTYDGLRQDSDFNLSDSLSDDIFIDMVRSRTWLYDLKDKNYGDVLMTRNAWRDIAEVMGDEASNCEKRWTRLKDKYFKEKLAREKETRSGSGKPSRPSWHLFEQMRPLMERRAGYRSTTSNVLSSVQSTSVDKMSQPKNYYKRNKTLKSEETEINSAIQGIFETICKIDENQKTKEQPEEKLDLDSDHLFGSLVTAELYNLEEKEAKAKYKLIMKYLSDLD